jgi:glycosyltransferase involved in cell wall biosynthesis
MRMAAPGHQPDVVHAAFASHTIFSLITELITDAAFVAQTFGGIEHAGAAERLGTFDRVDAYVSSSYRDLETLSQLGVPQEKLYSLDPPVFTGDFTSAHDENARAEFGIPEDDYVIGYLGNINEQRFPRAVTEQMETLACEGDNTVMVATKLIEDHPFADALGVEVIERHLDAREKRLFFQACDVLVFPFDFPDEHTAPIIDPPLSVLEAMAAARPIVTTDCLSLPELITDGETGYLCERGDVDGIVVCLRRLAEQPTERTQVGTAARELVETRHSPQRAADRLIEVYDEVTNK